MTRRLPPTKAVIKRRSNTNWEAYVDGQLVGRGNTKEAARRIAERVTGPLQWPGRLAPHSSQEGRAA